MNSLAKTLCLLILVSCLPIVALAQVDSTYHIKKSVDKMILDGKLSERSWDEAQVASSFFQIFPYDTSQAITPTLTRMTYDEKFIYVSAICQDTFAGKYIVQSLKRDFSYPKTDAFAVYLNPLADQTNGFCFGVSPLGVQREGLLEYGGIYGVTTSWDNKWYSKVVKYENKWVVEMAIPFRSLRYKQEQDYWRVNFSRHNLKIRENSVWSPVPRNYNVATMAFSGLLKWDAPPPAPGLNASVIPYVSSRLYEDYENVYPDEIKPAVGTDIKYSVTPSLNLDLTFNPDFSQVEVDAQITNLNRFPLFFPERRQFFIENGDMFSSLGSRQISPFFSRRIGLKTGQAIPILAGARLSGKINKDWRIGIMDIQTGSKASLNAEGQNYSVLALQRMLGQRSNISAFIVNKQGFVGRTLSDTNYNRVTGIEYNLFSGDRKWRGKVFGHQAFTPEKAPKAGAGGTEIAFTSTRVQATWLSEYAGQNYIAETGFVPRTNFYRLAPSANYYFYPKSKLINKHGPTLTTNEFYDTDFNQTDGALQPGYTVGFQNYSNLHLNLQERLTRLTFPWDPTNSGGLKLPLAAYNMRRLEVGYESDFRKRFYTHADLSYGSYFTGNRFQYGLELRYRLQPYGVFTIVAERNEIVLPTPYASAYIWLISPKFEFTFSRSVFFTLFTQYNTQIDNINLNARFQWRFAPMSDLFIVLTENYYGSDIVVKNRAVAIKLNYWLSP